MSGGDINPLHGTLFTGAGEPWGPMQTGDPGAMPGIPKATNPNDMQAYDQTAQVRALISGLKSAGSQENLAAQRQASAMGAGQSDAARQQGMNINSDVANRAAGVQLQAAQDAWNSKLQQSQFQDQMNMARYNAALQQWQAQKGMYDQEKAGRANGLKGAMSLGGTTILSDIGSAIHG